MSKKKRINPYKRPATLADVNKAKREAKNMAVEIAWSIFFTVLRDKEGYTQADLRRVWDEVEYLSDSITKGYCTVKDLRFILHDEAGVDLKD